MKYKVITTFKPDNWDRYAKRMVQSVLDNWTDVDITVYYQGKKPLDFKSCHPASAGQDFCLSR